VPRTIGQAWIDADQVLPLLDGLDEVQGEHRAACAGAINTFRQEHGLLPLAVCSRITEYEALGVQLRLQGAIVVQPLTRPQVDSYLAQVGHALAGAREALQADPTLWELLDTPLMLTIVTLAYAGQPAEALRTGRTLVERRQSLFATYVDRMFQRRSAATHYTRQQTERWLTWLAWQLTQHSQTAFLLERLQPDWLPLGRRWLPTHGARLLAALAGLVSGFLVGLGYGLLSGLGYGPLSGLASGLGGGLLVGLVGGLVNGLSAGIIGVLTGYSREITPIEMVRWSWSKFLFELFLPSRRSLRGGLFIGLLFGLLIGLLVGLGAAVYVGLVAGLLSGLLYKLSTGLAAGLSGGEITAKTVPNEGIHRSAWMAVSSGLGSGLGAALLLGLLSGLGSGLGYGPFQWLGSELGAGLLSGLGSGLGAGLFSGLGYGLGAGLLVGLVIGLKYGGRACLQHLVLRLSLRYYDCMPRRYPDFLDYAAERLFLRRVGGGYIFIQRLLQDHFATMYQAERADPSPPQP
jgi:eukaryotic-like serine/threonine-protein kinase